MKACLKFTPESFAMMKGKVSSQRWFHALVILCEFNYLSSNILQKGDTHRLFFKVSSSHLLPTHGRKRYSLPLFTCTLLHHNSIISVSLFYQPNSNTDRLLSRQLHSDSPLTSSPSLLCTEHQEKMSSHTRAFTSSIQVTLLYQTTVCTHH